jgi:hypothetical protein
MRGALADEGNDMDIGMVATTKLLETLTGGGSTDEKQGLLTRVLGPSADSLGAALGQYTEFRLNNVARIAEKADKKKQNRGSVPPRLAHKIIEEGSYCDDEVMAEYLSGVLAGGSTDVPGDDRAVSTTTTLTGMSSVQIRCHYLLYREWNKHFIGKTDLNLTDIATLRGYRLKVDLEPFIKALGLPWDNTLLLHVMAGLAERGLINAEYRWGPNGASPYATALFASPSFSGLDLWGWAHGYKGLFPDDFGTTSFISELDQTLPTLPSMLTSFEGGG